MLKKKMYEYRFEKRKKKYKFQNTSIYFYLID